MWTNNALNEGPAVGVSTWHSLSQDIRRNLDLQGRKKSTVSVLFSGGWLEESLLLYDLGRITDEIQKDEFV